MSKFSTPGRGVFVCGSPYTEVSTVAWALTAHPAFWTSAESRFLYRLFGSRADRERPYLYDIHSACAEDGAWLRTNAVGYPELLAALGDGIDRLFQSRAGRKRWVDNSPENALLIEELVHMFPRASFVGLLQPVRTALFIEGTPAKDITSERMRELATLNTVYTENLVSMANAMPDRVFLVEESDLFGSPETALRDLLEFLGEEYNPAVAEKFAHRLLKLNQTLADAKVALATFERAAPAPVIPS